MTIADDDNRKDCLLNSITTFIIADPYINFYLFLGCGG